MEKFGRHKELFVHSEQARRCHATHFGALFLNPPDSRSGTTTGNSNMFVRSLYIFMFFFSGGRLFDGARCISIENQFLARI